MATAVDVAAYILQKQGSMTAMKLQKLVYYAQAWSLVWDEEALFADKIKAWANGPVVTSLYAQHKGRFKLGPSDIAGDPACLSETQRETVDAVLSFYGDKTAQWLSDLTHREAPWLEARADAGAGENSNNEISLASMAEYYSSLSAPA